MRPNFDLSRSSLVMKEFMTTQKIWLFVPIIYAHGFVGMNGNRITRLRRYSNLYLHHAIQIHPCQISSRDGVFCS